jgi:hypothetical protein
MYYVSIFVIRIVLCVSLCLLDSTGLYVYRAQDRTNINRVEVSMKIPDL